VSAPHILIAGGGMVGISLALLLDRALPASARITLVEGARLPEGSAAPYHPSFDARSTALSYSSAAIYRDLGLWEDLLPGLGPISTIHVSRRGRPGSTLLSAAQQGWDALGWVVENPCLGRCLLAALRRSERIELRCPQRVVHGEAHDEGMRVRLDDEATLDCDLLVIADGAESSLRDQLAFLTRRTRYGQDALIANLALERDHGGCAYERFTDSGPLALLPLPPAPQAPSRMALVWTLPPEQALARRDCGAEEFAHEFIEAFGHRLGRLERVGERACYALSLVEAVEQVRRGCVVLGNAAHALHPVAGQGFNLALRDAHALSARLGAAIEDGASPGSMAVLRRYAQERSADQAQTIFASDSLPGLFMHSDPVLSLGRDLALAGLDFLPFLRREFARQAAGMAALERAHD
jgi:2-octaprenyl-6-methoxyphenol hydroxylase